MKVVYHAVPRNMVGDTIYPLLQLKEVASEAYEYQRAKYAGREAVFDYRIPDLDVLLNDTVHCAALDPRRLLDTRQRLGLPVPGAASATRWLTGLFFAIPLDRILRHRVVGYSGKTLWINGAPDEDVPLRPPDEEFELFDPETYEELAGPTAAHLAYLARMKRTSKLPLMFVHIPHVLVAGPIDVSGLEPIQWEARPAR